MISLILTCLFTVPTPDDTLRGIPELMFPDRAAVGIAKECAGGFHYVVIEVGKKQTIRAAKVRLRADNKTYEIDATPAPNAETPAFS